MKAVILAGGLGSRLSEETDVRPKPMVEIGGMPILTHIMSIYSSYGINDFVICLGYKGYVIKEFFANYTLHHSDVVVDMASRSIELVGSDGIPGWRVSLIDTGADTMTGGRLKRVRHLLNKDEPFHMTYGDGVADIDIGALTKFHKSHGLAATVTVVRQPARYGATVIEHNKVTRFEEKPAGEGTYINGGFFVLNPVVIGRIESDAMPWESTPLVGLAQDGQLGAYVHEGFWQSMDTLRDKRQLDAMWASGNAPWAKLLV